MYLHICLGSLGFHNYCSLSNALYVSSGCNGCDGIGVYILLCYSSLNFPVYLSISYFLQLYLGDHAEPEVASRTENSLCLHMHACVHVVQM